MKILIVEDDQRLSSLLAESLKQAHFAVDVAHDGIDGHHLGESEPYDAVVLDLGLPELDGVTVLEERSHWWMFGDLDPIVDALIAHWDAA